MTAEIIVMNKIGVAMAADSAVTFSSRNGAKIYQSVDKLFSLSNEQSVGIMIYGKADLNGVPWETIISAYRKYIGHRSLFSLSEYFEHARSFIESQNTFFPEKGQRDIFVSNLTSYFRVAIISEVDQSVKNLLESKENVSETEIGRILSREIKNALAHLEGMPDLQCFNNEFAGNLRKSYEKEISLAIEKAFQKHKISKTVHAMLVRIACLFLTKDIFPDGTSGVVIAGFGQDSVFPEAIAIDVHSVFGGKLRYKQLNESKIDVDSSAIIIPFAQSEMVFTFMEGTDPQYEQVVDSYMQQLLNTLPKVIASSMPGASESMVSHTMNAVKPMMKKLLEEFQRGRESYREEHNVRPVIDAVSVLPKDELSAMAEALVNLTSFKRRVSTTPETVGGPIDVAFISKGDGFVWVKKKQYFPADINPALASTYCAIRNSVGDSNGQERK